MAFALPSAAGAPTQAAPATAPYDQAEIEEAWTPPQPPDVFRVSDQGAIRDGNETVSLAGGRVQLALSQAVPETTVRYHPLDPSETGSSLGIAFELAVDVEDTIAPTVTVTLDYQDLEIPYRAAAASRLALFQQRISLDCRHAAILRSTTVLRGC